MLIQQENSSQTGRVEAGAKEQLSGIVQPYLAAISATVTGLDDPLIPFALLQHDPCPAFEQYMATPLQAQGGEQNMLDTAREAWMRPFADLRTEQLFFVYAWSSVAGSSPRVVESSGLVFGIGTPGPLQKRWCTTLPMMRQGELVAWCIEIDMSETTSPHIAEVTFSEEYMLRLA